MAKGLYWKVENSTMRSSQKPYGNGVITNEAVANRSDILDKGYSNSI